MAKTKTKTKIGGLPIETRARRKNLPRTAFKEGNVLGFKKGEGSPNPGGKPKADRDRLIGKSVIRYLQDRVSDEIAKAHGLAPGASWGMVLAKRLIRYALDGQQWAYSELLALTEVKRARLDVFGMGEEGDGAAPPLMILEFVESDGDGRPSKEFLAAHPDFVIEGESRPALPAPEVSD